MDAFSIDPISDEEHIAYWAAADSTEKDTIDLKYPIEDQSNTPFNQQESPFNLENPDNISEELYYDPETGNYYYKQSLGDDMEYRPENYMTFDEYNDYNYNQALQEYWKSKVSTENEFNKENGFEIPPVKVESEFFDRIFGGNTIDIRPSGSAELVFGVNISRTENPALPLNQRRITVFDFDQRIQLNVIGNIGEKLQLTTNYNTEATFDFENQVKVDYTGDEDDILQDIEAGNVTFPLSTQLIRGSQSLFGVKTQLRFGRLDVTTVFSQQRGQRSEIEVKGGAQINEFEIGADEYEENKHYFIGHFFRDNYEEATSSPPYVTSNVNITRIEVWVTNTSNITQNTRDVIAFQDLGEGDSDHLYNQAGNGGINVNAANRGVADNTSNTLYNNVRNNQVVRGFLNASTELDNQGYISRVDYHKVGLARKLEESEYYFHPQLGYISVNTALQPNQVLAVAYQYTYRGRTYQVGEFSTDVQEGQALYTKMLKSTQLNTQFPIWDLMMKNVYSLSAYQVQEQDFRLDIWYLDQQRGVETNYLPDGPPDVNGRPLIQVVDLDRLDVNKRRNRDGLFDFLPTNGNYIPTINPNNGRIYFPTLEPFGQTLREKLQDPTLGDLYAFDSLYTNTKTNAQVRYPDKNRYTIKGQYQSSSSSEISLNALNIPEGSVQVTAGGRTLTENVDYTVDYTLGRVKIINEGLMESGTTINISLESNAFFNIQTKTLIGNRFDYTVSEDFKLGATIMHLNERPLTQKVNVGEEPMSNTMWGVDGTYTTESAFLTRMVDKIPFIDTKEKSTVQVTGEFAQLIPGHNRAIGDDGNAYIDDFEGSQSTIDLRSYQYWTHASIPQGQNSLFPEAVVTNNLASGFNRAKLAWYSIDQSFWQNDVRTPDHIQNDQAMQSNHFMRRVPLDEVFPNRQAANFQLQNINTLDLAYYPSEKGPYNYDVNGYDVNGTQYGYGVNPDGTLQQPEMRWAGIQREITQQDFLDANIEYIQFWVMDPFNEDYQQLANAANDDGKLYLNLGTVSEDVQKDGQIMYENLLPTEASDITTEQFVSAFGRYTPGQSYVYAFDNDPDARQYQDVGLDGLRTVEEVSFFSDYISQMATAAPNADIQSDPSQDNFRFYLDDSFDAQQADILTRYKDYNNPEGNSPINDGTSASAAVGSTRPTVEDINQDNNLDEAESYWQYEVDFSPEQLTPANIGNNYIVDVQQSQRSTADGRVRDIDWYLFRIPINDGQSINNIADFRSIRFMRMFMKGFEHPIVLRFARLELVRGEWRRYEGSLESPGDYIQEDESTSFVVQAVNIEENSDKQPVNYVLPPGIEREINVGTTNLQQLNEQSLSASVCGLRDGDARAAYKSLDLDIRNYGKLKMFVHAESSNGATPVQDGEITAFIRLGSDFTNNYYEYEIPLVITPDGEYSNSSNSAREQVWPEQNNIEIDFDVLQSAKTSRNRAAIANPEAVTTSTRYAYADGRATVYIVGNPNLNTVKTAMLGIRNPKAVQGGLDDGLPKCAEVWFNELRLSDFNSRAGWAAVAQMTTQLADLATVSISGAMSTPGWGQIEDKVSDRQMETIQQFDFAANIDLGKFLPEETGIKIPTYVGYSEMVSRPQYAPLSPDIEFDDYLDESFTDEGMQDSVRRVQETREINKSINFTNVRKEKTNPEKKARFYDVSNLSATLSYAEQNKRDFNTEYNTTKTYRGGLTYNYSANPKNYQPFSKMKPFRKSKYLRLIRDFNFYLIPKQYSFTTNINRIYNEQKIRNNQPGIVAETEPFYNKSFNWNRQYSLRWDLSRALKLDFSASNVALIEEPNGPVNRGFYREEYDHWRDSVWNNIANLGTNTNYNHQTNLTYTVPLNKIPVTDWINSTVRYGSTYGWERAAFSADSLGNTIQNSQQWQVNASFNFVSLYNKVKFFREVNRKSRLAERKGNSNRKAEKENAKNDSTNTKKERDKDDMRIIDHIGKALMMVKNASASYSVNQGIMLPGYKSPSQLLGSSPDFSSPGFGFLFGQQSNFGTQNQDFLSHAMQRDWLVQEETFNKMYTETYSEQANFRVNIEPIKDLRIELTADWDYGESYSTFNRWYDTLDLDEGVYYNRFLRESPITTGNFTVTFMSIRTAFVQDGSNYVNSTFEQFSENRQVISERLAAENEYSEGLYVSDSTVLNGTYYDGYGPTHPDVLIPAFLAAYSGNSASSTSLNALNKIPMPNWRVTYTGLSKLKFFKKHFKTVTLGHGYRSIYSVSSFTSNVDYSDPEGRGYTSERDPVTQSNFLAEYNYQTVTIRESFSPLLNIDMTWNNSLITKVEFIRDRTLSLSLTNAQVTEVRANEYVVGLGYTFKQVPLPFTLKSKRNKIQSDLTTRGDFSIRDNYTVLRKLDTQNRPNEATSGQRILSLKLTANYKLSNKLTIQMYFDRLLTTPRISTSYPTATTDFGFSVRFTLS